MDFSDEERRVLLTALHELWVTRSEFEDEPNSNVIPIVAISSDTIKRLVRRLGGDPDAPMFGSKIGR
jgi:hypothetical protein